MQKIQVSKKHKKQIFIYSLTILTISLFCSSPFWFPSLCSSMNVFSFVSLPKVCLLIISPKHMFIVGNLIVVILIGESKFFASDSCSASNVYYDEYISKCKSSGARQTFSILKVEDVINKKQEKYCYEENLLLENNERAELDGKVDHHFAIPAEELNKRADDFIARVKLRRRLEEDYFVVGDDQTLLN